MRAVPGWTSAVALQTLSKPMTIDVRQEVQALDTISWTATDAGLPVGEYQQFSIDAELLPDSPTIVFKALQSYSDFKALQSYSDGTEVDWIEQPAPGSTTKPDHPAPALTLAPAADSTSSPASSSAAGSSESGRGLAVSGLVLGILAILISGAALVIALRRRPT